MSAEAIPLGSGPTERNPVSTVGAVIFTADLVRMQKFYERVTKLAVTDIGDGFVVMDQLILVQLPADTTADMAALEISDPPERRDGSPVRLLFDVPGLAAARVRAAQIGGMVDPTELAWEFGAFRVCDGHDPEGNPIQFREPL